MLALGARHRDAAMLVCRPSAAQAMVPPLDQTRTVEIDYHDGPRYPHLQRIDGTPDYLSRILASRP